MKQMGNKFWMLKCEGWRGRALHIFDGCFVFTAVPQASFNYFKSN